MVVRHGPWPMRVEELRETGEDRENDDKMDVWSDIEGQMQERGVVEAFEN